MATGAMAITATPDTAMGHMVTPFRPIPIRRPATAITATPIRRPATAITATPIRRRSMAITATPMAIMADSGPMAALATPGDTRIAVDIIGTIRGTEPPRRASRIGNGWDRWEADNCFLDNLNGIPRLRYSRASG